MPCRGLARALAGACALTLVLAPGAGAATLPDGFEERELVAGLTRPMSVAWTPDGRMLIAEKDGVLKQVLPGQPVATVLLDISDDVNSSDDRGLLGLAVDSDFESNGFIYLLYTYEPDNYVMYDSTEPALSRLSRYVLGAGGIDPGSETTLLGSWGSAPCPPPSNDVDCIPSDSSTHSIGTVHSAPDGTLFVGSGDAAGFAAPDPDAFRSYDERSMAGKILRVDRNGDGVATNGFCGLAVTKVCRKVYAKGFRNPFRFALLPDGSLSVGDVGWFQYEEVSRIRTGGGSYGWPCYEGRQRTPGYEVEQACIDLYAAEQAGTRPRELAPFYDYPHEAMSSAAMGGPLYEGDDYPAGYNGSLFFSDYGAGFIKRFALDANGDPVGAPIAFAANWLGVELDTAPNGDLVYVSPGDFLDGTGSVVRIAYSPGNRTPLAAAAADPRQGTAPLAVDFSSAGSADPDGDALGYS